MLPNEETGVATATCSGDFEVPIEQRPLLTDDQVRPLEAMFKILANGTRLRLLHALIREPTLCVSDIAARIGMKPQAVSNQLQRLSDRGILDARRNGNQVHYSIADCCVTPLLTYGLCLAQDSGALSHTEESGRV
ncbi:MAG TPA: metalloregulator ArsR/SmtB family transcription factor [Deferrisomatales bacterium]|nr:metalloregulator ArsR/SmtB family transcription factor [Deferrisomatales bacterium]